MYFRETKLGMSLREYLVILHVLAYPLFWSGRIDSERFTKFTILHIVITLIIYYLLSKEPARTKLIAIEHLKEAFKYYCSPHGKPLLSKKEKELFEENFKVRVSNRDSHIQGHFSKGVYNNQEFSYWVTLHVDDLKSGHSYSLEYPTNSKHEAWGTIYNTEILTKKGLRLKSF